MKKFVLACMFAVGCGFLIGPVDAQLIPRLRPTLNRPALFVPAPTTLPLPMQTAPIASPVSTEFSSKQKLGPVACAAVRLELAKTYRTRDGLSRVEALVKAREATDATINAMIPEAEKVAQTKVTGAKFGAIGDGTIINAIIEWFKSPQGQALIQALIDLLIHALGV